MLNRLILNWIDELTEMFLFSCLFSNLIEHLLIFRLLPKTSFNTIIRISDYLLIRFDIYVFNQFGSLTAGFWLVLIFGGRDTFNFQVKL